MILRSAETLWAATAVGVVLACACGSDTSSSAQPPLVGGAGGGTGDASAGMSGKGGAATGGKAGAGGTGNGGSANGGTGNGGSANGGAGNGGSANGGAGNGGSANGGNGGTSTGGNTTGGAGGSSGAGAGGLPANPTPQDWGAKTIDLAAPFAQVTTLDQKSSCASLGPVAGTQDTNFWTPDGPPRAYKDPANTTHLIVPHMLTYQFTGPSLDNLALDCNKYISTSAFDVNPANDNDASWPWSPYLLPDGRLFALFHHEYHGWAHVPPTCVFKDPPWPQNCWHPSLTFGIAADGKAPGDGERIKRPVPNHVIARWDGSDPVGGGGFSDPTNIMLNPADGKYYMMALVRGLVTSNGDYDVMRNCVLRTSDLTNPAAWEAWNGSAFVGPLHNGASCADVTGQTNANASAPGSLVYSTYFNRVLYLTFALRPDGRHGFFVRAALNNELTQWSAQTIVLGVRLPWGGDYVTPMQIGDPYPSFLDPDAGAANFDRIGQRPYLYWVRTFLGSPIREIWRVRLEFYAGAPERDNRVKGYFRTGQAPNQSAHFSNGQGAYCNYASMYQLNACGYTWDFNAMPDFKDPGADVQQGPNPHCACGYNPQGCFAVGTQAYFANGNGASCPLEDCQLPRICSVSAVSALPQKPNTGPDQMNGKCTNPAGCYKDGTAGRYSNGNGYYCTFSSVQQMNATCAPMTFDTAPPGCPGGDQYNGPC